MNRWTTLLASASTAGAALLLAACGAGSPASATARAGSAPRAASAPSRAAGGAGASSASPMVVPMAAPVLGVGASSLGPVLVDPGGRAVYLFTADRPGQPACTGACLATWPAVPATAMPLDPPGATAQLGVLVRSDGTRQLTVDGFPAYTFTGDTTAGTTAGQGDRLDGGTFELLTPTGSPIAPPAPPPPPVPAHPSTVVPGRTLPAPPPVVSRPPVPMPIPQGDGGDRDGDNRGGPNDGDGGV